MNFQNMTDRDLELSLKSQVAQERKTLHVILEHIREVDARKLHLKRAFGSLREYLVKEFGYSGTAADRRVEAAQLMRDVPVIAEKVRDGILNLSQIGEVHSAIKQKERVSRCKVSAEEKHQLIECVEGLSVREAQKELSQVLDIPIMRYEKIRIQQDGSAVVEMTLSKETFEYLTQLKESSAQLLTQNHQEINLANALQLLIMRQNELDENKKSKDSVENRSTSISLDRTNKTLTPKTRSLVLSKTGCCEFKDSRTGRVCGSRFILQADHKRSRRFGGDHSLNNLQALCARHNRFKFEQEKNLELRFFG